MFVNAVTAPQARSTAAARSSSDGSIVSTRRRAKRPAKNGVENDVPLQRANPLL